MCFIKDTEEAISIQSGDKPVLGGDKVLVVIEVVHFVSAHAQIDKYLIGMAEIKEIPMKTYFEYGDYNNNIDLGALIHRIKSKIAAGSWLVFDDRLYCDESIKLLSDFYPVIVKRSQLERLNTEEQNVNENLTLVWDYALHNISYV